MGCMQKILEKTTNYNGKQIPRFITMFNGKKGACMVAPLRVPFRHGQHERNRIKMSPQFSTIYSVAGLCHGWLAGWITSFQWQACSWCSFCGAMFQIFKATWQQLKCQVQKCISGWVMSYEKSFWLRKTEPDEQNVADDWHDPDMDYFTRDSSSVVPTPSHHLQASHGECHAAPWHHRCESAFTSVYGSCMHACIRNIICIIYTCVHAVCINMCMHVHPTHTIYSGEYLLTTAWTKDLGPSVASALTTLAEGFDGEKFDWQCVRKYNLVNHCALPRAGPLPTCGKF